MNNLLKEANALLRTGEIKQNLSEGIVAESAEMSVLSATEAGRIASFIFDEIQSTGMTSVEDTQTVAEMAGEYAENIPGLEAENDQLAAINAIIKAYRAQYL